VKRMHDDEVDVSAELVRRLLVSQSRDPAELPASEVQSTGTV
jgi:hypothetical protein